MILHYRQYRLNIHFCRVLFLDVVNIVETLDLHFLDVSSVFSGSS